MSKTLKPSVTSRDTGISVEPESSAAKRHVHPRFTRFTESLTLVLSVAGASAYWLFDSMAGAHASRAAGLTANLLPHAAVDLSERVFTVSLIIGLGVLANAFVRQHNRSRSAAEPALHRVRVHSADGERTVISLCMICKRVQNREEAWVPLETWLVQQTGRHVSHGLCPECYAAEYPERD